MSDNSESAKRILVAEDDVVFRRVIEFTLGRAGFQVSSVSHGQLAWQALQAEPFNCLVTDHQMPVMSGIELLNGIRACKALAHLPAILCTAKGLEMDSDFLSKRYGLAAVLHKPFSPRKLADLLHDCCLAQVETLGPKR